jgi:hypothetical protein
MARVFAFADQLYARESDAARVSIDDDPCRLNFHVVASAIRSDSIPFSRTTAPHLYFPEKLSRVSKDSRSLPSSRLAALANVFSIISLNIADNEIIE